MTNPREAEVAAAAEWLTANGVPFPSPVVAQAFIAGAQWARAEADLPALNAEDYPSLARVWDNPADAAAYDAPAPSQSVEAAREALELAEADYCDAARETEEPGDDEEAALDRLNDAKRAFNAAVEAYGDARVAAFERAVRDASVSAEMGEQRAVCVCGEPLTFTGPQRGVWFHSDNVIRNDHTPEPAAVPAEVGPHGEHEHECAVCGRTEFLWSMIQRGHADRWGHQFVGSSANPSREPA